MKILHVSIYDSNGCTSAAYRIHRSVKDAGADSTLLVRERTLSDPTVKGWAPDAGLLQRAWWRLRKEWIRSAMKPYGRSRPKGLESFTDSRSPFGPALLPDFTGYDLLHLHWFREFIDWSLLSHPQLSGMPLVLTMHDTIAFTGGCHYTNSCERYVEKCGSCPQLGSASDQDLSRRNWERKHRALSRRNGPTRVVGCSKWIAQKARTSSLLGSFPVDAIHNGVDVNVFRPRDKASARALLGIPADAAVIMFISVSISNIRKGLPYLAEALKGLKSSRKIVLLSVGAGNPVLPDGLTHVRVGEVNNELFLSLIYSAADMFAIPSLEENFALTALEASACGLPVIGFDVGGIPELVENGRTGFVVPSKDSAALAARILELIADPALCARMGAASRERVQSQFTQETMGRNYVELYSRCLTKTK